MSKGAKKPAHDKGKRVTPIPESSLWDHVKKTVEPLDSEQRAIYSQALHEYLESNPKAPDARHGPKSFAPTASPASLPTVTKTKAKGQRNGQSQPPIIALDRKVRRRISKGSTPIDATIDLHGMRQSEAENALRGFIWRCHSRSMKTVLVITGKGSRAPERQPEDPPWAVGSGILRRAVPGWLSSKDMRAAILSFEAANPSHGGEGALYVRLRTNKQNKRGAQ